MYIGGSFITRKREAADLDVVLDCAEMPAEPWPTFARYILRERSRWKRHVDVHLAHPDVPRDVRDLFRADRRGRARQLVVAAP